MKKRIGAIIICLAMVIALVPMWGLTLTSAAVITDSGKCGGNVTWKLDSDGVLTISGSGDMDDWNFESRSPWYENKKITGIVIEEGVSSIGGEAFSGCDALTSVKIPDSVTKIGYSAFHLCSSLTEIRIPDGVTEISSDVFYGCSSLTEIKIPDGVTEIGSVSFSGCFGLTRITIPDNVTRIGFGAFSWCEGLTEVIIPDRLTEIGDSAFYACSQLTEITIPGSVTDIGGSAFGLCSNLRDLYFGGTKTQWDEITKKVSEPLFDNGSSVTIHYKNPDKDKFSDVTSDTVNATSYKAINWAVDNGIVKGYPDGTFKPELICTREQFSIMLWRLAGEPSSDVSSVNQFADVSSFSNDTAKKAVAWAVEQGIVKGFSDGGFHPKDDITRAQVVMMLWRFTGEPSVSDGSSRFSDISSLSANVRKAINWAEQNKIASGYQDGTFRPDDGCQRQHMAIFLNRYYSKFMSDN